VSEYMDENWEACGPPFMMVFRVAELSEKNSTLEMVGCLGTNFEANRPP